MTYEPKEAQRRLLEVAKEGEWFVGHWRCETVEACFRKGWIRPVGLGPDYITITPKGLEAIK